MLIGVRELVGCGDGGGGRGVSGVFVVVIWREVDEFILDEEVLLFVGYLFGYYLFIG